VKEPPKRGALGCIRNRKTEEKIVQNRKTAKKIRPKPKTAYKTIKADTAITSEAYTVNYTNTNFIKVFVKSWTCFELSEAFVSFGIF